jgi:hypothetical protein
MRGLKSMSKNTKEERNAQLRGRLKPDVTGPDKSKQEGGEICAASPLIEPPRPDEITEER